MKTIFPKCAHWAKAPFFHGNFPQPEGWGKSHGHEKQQGVFTPFFQGCSYQLEGWGKSHGHEKQPGVFSPIIIARGQKQKRAKAPFWDRLLKQSMLLCFCITTLLAQDNFVGDVFDRGKIDYGNRTIQATGIGFIPANVINAGQARRSAMRIAKQDALRQLIEIVNGVNVTSETTISGAMFDDMIKTQVQGAIRGARQVGEPRYLSDTSVEVTYEVSMNDISRVLLPMADKAPTLTYDAVSTSTPSANPSTPIQETATAAPTSGGVTGIIIDATGLGLRPAMSPRILNQGGSVIYGPGQYSRDYAATNGVVGYAKSLDQAKSDSRVQGNPLVLRAASTSGAASADVVISNADGGKLTVADGSAGLLKNCRVMFVLD